jgi:hypothetical protein
MININENIQKGQGRPIGEVLSEVLKPLSEEDLQFIEKEIQKGTGIMKCKTKDMDKGKMVEFPMKELVEEALEKYEKKKKRKLKKLLKRAVNLALED